MRHSTILTLTMLGSLWAAARAEVPAIVSAGPVPAQASAGLPQGPTAFGIPLGMDWASGYVEGVGRIRLRVLAADRVRLQHDRNRCTPGGGCEKRFYPAREYGLRPVVKGPEGDCLLELEGSPDKLYVLKAELASGTLGFVHFFEQGEARHVPLRAVAGPGR